MWWLLTVFMLLVFCFFCKALPSTANSYVWEEPSIPESPEPHPKHDIRLSLDLPLGLNISSEGPLPCPNQHPDPWQTSHPILLSWALTCPWKPDHLLTTQGPVPNPKGEILSSTTPSNLRPFSEISELRRDLDLERGTLSPSGSPTEQCDSLGGLLSLSEPYFPYLWNGNDFSPAYLVKLSWCSVAQTGGRVLYKQRQCEEMQGTVTKASEVGIQAFLGLQMFLVRAVPRVWLLGSGVGASFYEVGLTGDKPSDYCTVIVSMPPACTTSPKVSSGFPEGAQDSYWILTPRGPAMSDCQLQLSSPPPPTNSLPLN